jgi:PmbA protein
MGAISLRDSAEGALALMRARGFDEAQVTASSAHLDEVSIIDTEPNLLRSTDSLRLSLTGIVDGRKAATELSDLGAAAVRDSIDALRAAVSSAPQDSANKVSSGQRARIVQGPQQSDVDLLTGKARELVDYFPRAAPKVRVRESVVAHHLGLSHTLTTGGTDLEAQVGHHTLAVLGVARDGRKVSSMYYAGGDCHELDRHPAECFGISEMLADLERSIDTRPMGAKFTGDVILTPMAVESFVSWFLGQLCDTQLIAGSSLYRRRVGEAVGSPLLTLKSRFDAPGVTALTGDAFVAAPVELLRQGVLKTLTPSLYGSLKTGLPHVPIAAAGWEVAAGETPREKMVSDTQRGAIVGRLSMGRPASNGDFSGVIKNSFAVVDGKLGHALSETMITGNVAQMLKDVISVSRERIDTGAFLLPWVRIGNLHFS